MTRAGARAPADHGATFHQRVGGATDCKTRQVGGMHCVAEPGFRKGQREAYGHRIGTPIAPMLCVGSKTKQPEYLQGCHRLL